MGLFKKNENKKSESPVTEVSAEVDPVESSAEEGSDTSNVEAELITNEDTPVQDHSETVENDNQPEVTGVVDVSETSEDDFLASNPADQVSEESALEADSQELQNSESIADSSVTDEQHVATENEGADSETSPEGEEEEEEIEEPLDPEILAEIKEYEEDLSILDGRILPELNVPNWRDELEFVKERYEPCDLTDHIVKVSKRRLVARRIDHELAQSRLTAYNRYLDRAARRFKDRIDEDSTLNEALEDISQWRSDQAKSVAWLLVDRINEEVLKAKQAEKDATSFVQENTEFTNKNAIAVYRKFARSLFVIPLATAYVMSVVMLTYTNFEWIMKFLPLFNLGLAKTQWMIAGVSSYFLIRAFWRYSREVAKIQKQLSLFTLKYQEQEKRIKHAVTEHTRLSQQQPLVEPILQVLSKAYRVQLQSDVTIKAQATTQFDPNTLPACVTLARAIDNEEDKIARMKRRALNVLMSPGWRTRGLNEIASIHADSRMLDSHALSLSSLDTDSMVSATSAQKLLLEAFGDTSIHARVSKRRLVSAIKEIHSEVLANWASEDRPSVVSLRSDGFDKISFRTSWLADEDASEAWIPFLTEILSDDTAPFGQFNILDKSADLNKPGQISSVAVVPHYFSISDSKIRIEHSKSKEVMPLDVTVRVDVSPWSEPNAFAVFAKDIRKISQDAELAETLEAKPKGAVTDA
jgi:hypothetical protein